MDDILGLGMLTSWMLGSGVGSSMSLVRSSSSSSRAGTVLRLDVEFIPAVRVLQQQRVQWHLLKSSSFVIKLRESWGHGVAVSMAKFEKKKMKNLRLNVYFRLFFLS